MWSRRTTAPVVSGTKWMNVCLNFSPHVGFQLKKHRLQILLRTFTVSIFFRFSPGICTLDCYHRWRTRQPPVPVCGNQIHPVRLDYLRGSGGSVGISPDQIEIYTTHDGFMKTSFGIVEMLIMIYYVYFWLRTFHFLIVCPTVTKEWWGGWLNNYNNPWLMFKMTCGLEQEHIRKCSCRPPSSSSDQRCHNVTWEKRRSSLGCPHWTIYGDHSSCCGGPEHKTWLRSRWVCPAFSHEHVC